MVPHLKTALNGPLLALEKQILERSVEVEHWFSQQWLDHPPPFYTSCDVRNAGFKLAPIDTNLFPAGFNNLNPAFMSLCIHAVQAALAKLCPQACRLLLIPENHTRNTFYLDHLLALQRVLQQSGILVRLGTVNPEITTATELTSASGGKLLIEPIVRCDGPNGARLMVDGFNPCMILLNNDLSAGPPAQLLGLSGEQTLLPPLHAGWTVRRKSYHFAAYDQTAVELARVLGVDPWFINPIFTVCQQVDFHGRRGEECLADNVSAVLAEIREKYRSYAIDEKPYVVVKADAGTYGMGVMTVHDASEVVAINRRTRNKMSVVKDGLAVSEVLIQEGVHTFETVDDAVAEPVVYMIDRYVVGGFYRVHDQRGRDENLNAPGMHFRPLSFETCCSQPDHHADVDAPPNRFYAYGVVARLAALAAARELEYTLPQQAVGTDRLAPSPTLQRA